MLSGKTLLCFLFITLAGVSASSDALDIVAPVKQRNFNPNLVAFKKAKINEAPPTRFWDPSFCSEWSDGDVFPHPDSCSKFLMCFNGKLFDGDCPIGMNFDVIFLWCDDKENVRCFDRPGEKPDPCRV